MNTTRTALEWIAKEAGNYADGGPEASATERMLAEIEGRAKEALETETPDGMGRYLRTLCKLHGLTSAAVNFNTRPDGSGFFYAYVHWIGANGASQCTGESGPDVGAAIENALENMRRQREAAEAA